MIQPRSRTLWGALLAMGVAQAVQAAPTTAPDVYTVAEDSVLTGAGSVILSTDFDDAPLAFAASWDLLNTLPIGGSYPVDTGGRTWSHPQFNPASLPGGSPAWTVTTMPAAGPNSNSINYFNNNSITPAATLTGNANSITHLLRNTFTVSAQDAARTGLWTLRYLIDDGAVVYLNGQEIARLNMPNGALTPDTLATTFANEDALSQVSVDLSGKLVAGTNVLAVEIHQSDASTDAGFDMALLRPGATFSYVADVFNPPSSPGPNGFNSGSISADSGNNGTTGLRVDVGNRSPQNASTLPLSGGFQTTLNVPSAGTYKLTLSYRGTVTENYDSGEFIEGICRVDNTRYGSVAASGSLSGSGVSLFRFEGNGNGNNGEDTDTGWQTVTFDVTVTAGTHTLTLGLFNSTSSGSGFRPESSTVRFDDIHFGTGAGGDQSGVLANDTGTGTLTAAKVTDPTHGTLDFQSTGAFTYTPAANYFGQDSFTYTATDSTGTSAPTTVTINVLSVNDPPVATAEAYDVAEDSPLSVGAPGVLANDSDLEGGALSAILVRNPANGTIVLNPDGSFTYTPNFNFSGVDNFQYRASDGTDTSSVVTVGLTVLPINDAPLPVNDTYTTTENTPLVISAPTGTSGPVTLIAPDAVWKYLDNGTDQGTAWRATAFDDTTWKSGAAELGYGDGDETTVVEDNATPGYNAGDSDRYVTTYFRKSFTVDNPSALTAVTLRVKRDDGVVIYLNGTEIARDGVSAGQDYQTLASNANDDGANFNTLTLPTSLPFVTGTNVIAAEIHQNTTASSDISFALEFTATATSNAGVLFNDVDPEGDAMTAVLVTQPTKGTLTFNPNGTFTYTPNQGVRSNDSFTYRATDGTLQSAPATVTIVINAGPNAAPIGNADTYAGVEDFPVSVSAALGVLANDTDPEGDPLTAVLVAAPAKGSVLLAADGSFTYTPNPDANGQDTFTYRAKDDLNNQSGITTVTLNIQPTNDAPVAVADAYGVDPGTTANVTQALGVLANDTDIDGNSLTAQLVTAVSTGSLTLNANGSFTYTPPVGYTGNATFAYRASDGTTTSNTVTVTLSVNGRPVAGADSFTTVEDTSLNVTAANGVLKNDTDPENSPLTAQLTTPPTHGTVTLNANGSFVYTPAGNFAGPDSFTYVAFDGGRASLPATVSLTVTPVNDPPSASDDDYRTPPDETLAVSAAEGVLSNDSDAESSPLTATLVTPPASGSLTLNPDGSFEYVPVTGFVGVVTFTYTASDGTLASDPATVTLTVAQNASDIVISEIMYRPGTDYPEATNLEWLELYNRGTRTIDLGGWQFTRGVAYTFPAGRTLSPGQYLVVAANVAAFQSAHSGVANVVGGWTGTLSNNSETITLSDATGSEADSVTYATDGDWAQRIRETQFNGWDWVTPANGSDHTVEVRNPAISNDNGQNWLASVAPGGTPGAANSVASSNIAPIIKAVKHYPPLPKTTDRVVISCELNDDSPESALSATLHWRNATTTSPGAFTDVPMSRDDDGTWFAPVLPSAQLADRSIIEFYVSATDGTSTRTWPAETGTGQNANCQYIVTNESPSTTTEMYFMVLTGAENSAFNGVNSGSDRQFNHTLIVIRGQETSVHYRCDMRIRGNSSRSYQFRPLRITIPGDDDKVNGNHVFNFGPRSSYLQYLGMRLFQAAGLRAPDAIPIEYRRNGVESTTSTNNTSDYGKWAKIEDVGREFVNNHWPLADSGNVYKKGRNDWFWRATQTAPTDPDGSLDGFTKQNNSSVNDWSDLTSFFTTWMGATSPHFPGSNPLDVAESGGSTQSSNGNWDGTALSAAEMSSIETVSDLDQWARWFAVMTILQDNETNISNGEDDDYAVYFEPRLVGQTLQRRMQLIPHDLDTIFGLGDQPLSFNDRGIYDMTANGNRFRPLLPLFGNSLATGNATFRAKYFAELKNLMSTLFDADTTNNPNPPFYQFVDRHLGDWVPAARIAAIKDFVTQRNAFLLSEMGETLTAPPVPTSNPTFTSAHGTLMISEVLAQNVAAHSNGGLFPDVIELRNTGATAVSLAGRSLTDDPAVKDKYVFPAGTTIPAGGFLTVYADTATTSPGLHTGFGLDAKGDALYLYDTVASGQAVIDSVVFGLQVADFSIGRTGATLDVWALCTPTIGAANTTTPLSAPAFVRINEWLGNADYYAEDDFVELYNTAAQPVALGGMRLTDDFVNYPTRGLFPALSFVGPNAFLLFEAKGDNATPGDVTELPYGIDSTVGNIALLGANAVLVDRVETVAQFRDVSVGRLPDGTGTFSRQPAPTPGFSNGGLSEQALAAVNYLRITELMYNPASSSQSEYIEFHNISEELGAPVTLDLGGITFTNGLTWTFAPGTTLAPGAYLVVAGEPDKFSAQFGSVPALGPFSGKLDNGGERLRFAVGGTEVAILDFDYNDSWYPSTDGGGDALQIVNPLGSPGLWDKSYGWQAAAPSPGAASAFGVNAGPDVSGVSGAPIYLGGSVYAGTYTEAVISLAWTKESGPGTVTFTTGAYHRSSATFSAPGVYTVRLTGTSPAPATASDLATVTVLESYDAWAARTMSTLGAAQRDPEADPDADGLTNLAEYALGTDPRTASSPFTVSRDGNRLTLTYTRNPLADPDLVITPQISGELGTWLSGDNVLIHSYVGSNGTVETWQVQDIDPITAGQRRFLRLVITQQ